MTVPASWHEDVRGRAIALLIRVDDRLPRDTVQIAHELVDANEYGVAIEILADVLYENQQVLTAEEASHLLDLSTSMQLDRRSIDHLVGGP